MGVDPNSINNITSNNTYLKLLATSALVTASLVLSAVYFFRKKKDTDQNVLENDIIPEKWCNVGRIKEINLYPLKSGHAMHLRRANVTINNGLEQLDEDEKVYQLKDGILGVYDEETVSFITCKDYTKLVLVEVAVHDEQYLSLEAPSMRILYVKLPAYDSPKTTVSNWSNEKLQSIDCGYEAASWISRYLSGKEKGLRLAFNDKNTKKLGNTKINQTIETFSSFASVSLLNQFSVDDLNTRLSDDHQVTPDHFRSNIVVEGPPAYSEDSWNFIKIGDVILRNVKECTRCEQINVDPVSAKKDEFEPLTTLRSYRTNSNLEKNPIFGVCMEIIKPGIIHIEDLVEASES